MSGNGIRCLAHAALDAGWVVRGRPLRGDDAGRPAGGHDPPRRPSRARPGRRWRWARPRCAARSSAATSGTVSCSSTSATRTWWSSAPTRPPSTWRRSARLLEATDPAGLNVEFVALGPGPDEVTMRVWERGVGETQACGTGACAAAAALHHWGRVGRSVTVHQPGGAAAVELRCRRDGRRSAARACTSPPAGCAREPDRTQLPGEDRPGRGDRPARTRGGDRAPPRRAGPSGRHGRGRRGRPGACSGATIPTRRPMSGGARPRSCATCPWRSTPTRWSSTTS